MMSIHILKRSFQLFYEYKCFESSKGRENLLEQTVKIHQNYVFCKSVCQ